MDDIEAEEWRESEINAKWAEIHASQERSIRNLKFAVAMMVVAVLLQLLRLYYSLRS